MSRMCREKGAVKHDDRIDALAQGVKYFTDSMSISAQEVVNLRKREEWNDMIQGFIEDPQAAKTTSSLVWIETKDNKLEATPETVSLTGLSFANASQNLRLIPPVSHKTKK